MYKKVFKSDFVKPIWIDGYFQMNFENGSTKQTLANSDFRTDGLLIFNNVLFLCNWANETFSNAKTVFNQDNFVSAEVFSRMY